MVVGEISSSAHIDYQNVIRHTIKHIGYDNSDKGIYHHHLQAYDIYLPFSDTV